MAYINFQPSDFFNTVLYTGDGTAIGSGGQSITGVGFQPDWVWTKARSQPHSHTLYDSSRGVQKPLVTNSNASESTETEGLNSFDSDGFTTGNKDNSGQSGTTYASWHWKANGGTTSSNSDGSITSTVQANTTSGFSVVTYTGTGTAGTVGHGLGSTVAMVITKSRDSASAWQIYNKDLGKDKTVQLNETASTATISNYWGTSTPNSTVFGVIGGGYNNNLSGQATIAYCFAEVKGYSKFGSYTGNGSNDGPFVYTGFRPSFIMYKNTSRSTAGAIWWMWDTTRDTRNPTDLYLRANDSLAEGSFDSLDILSNGFKLRTSDGGQNASGETIIYMAFAENPFVTSTSIPVTAR